MADEKPETSEKRIDALRAILTQAAERDEELKTGLMKLATEFLTKMGAGATALEWAEQKGAHGERQLDEHFVMADGWLRGELVVEVTPDEKFSVILMIRRAEHGTHEVGVQKEPSQTVVVDPPEEKDRAAAREKIFTRIFDHLERQIRQRVALPAK
jgi:hypothetical protein